MDRVTALFSVMSSNLNTPEIQELSQSLEPKLQEIEDKVTFNEKLFLRIEAVKKAIDKAGLSPEQRRLVEKKYEEFMRRGASLPAAKKVRLGAINQELAKLFTDFGNRVQADEDTWVVLKQEDLAGLPDSLVQAYKAAAEQRKIDGYAVVNTRSAVDPFLDVFSESRVP